jgi:peptidyl-prolyl cis-trans isomerase A (cyclophilin A)
MMIRALSFLTVVFSISVAPWSAAAQVRKAAAGFPAPTGPTVLIDTSEGRLACRLFDKEAPKTSAHFLGLVGAGFYDGSPIVGVTDGVVSDGKPGGNAGADFPVEKSPGLTLERAGVLGMSGANGMASAARIVVLEHADEEYKGRIAPFGLCDDASVINVAAIAHKTLSAGNRLAQPVMINKVSVVKEGEALPPLAPNGPAMQFQYPPIAGADIPAPEPKGPTAVIDTTMGTLTCRLFNETKVATENFVGLATGVKAYKNASKVMVKGKPYYNGLHFNRVIPDFMVEQGDLPADADAVGATFGIESVPGLLFDRPGRLAYANSGPGTNRSEWFVTEVPQHLLDGEFTIFGQCDDASVKVVAAIARVPRDARNKPLKPVTVKSVAIQR